MLVQNLSCRAEQHPHLQPGEPPHSLSLIPECSEQVHTRGSEEVLGGPKDDYQRSFSIHSDQLIYNPVIAGGSTLKRCELPVQVRPSVRRRPVTNVPPITGLVNISYILHINRILQIV